MLHSLFFVERIFRTIKTVTTHRSVSPLLSTVLPRPAPQLSVPGAALYVDAVDDVEELLHHGHLLEDELYLAVHSLEHEMYDLNLLFQVPSRKVLNCTSVSRVLLKTLSLPSIKQKKWTER